MICPKCGFDQPGGSECRKCGVVIAKYLSAVKRREEPDHMLPDPPGAVMDYTPVEALTADLKGIQEENKRLWGEIQYLKADKAIVKDEMGSLRRQADDLVQATGQRAGVAEVQKLAQDLAETTRLMEPLRTTVRELSGVVETLHAAVTGQPALAREMEGIKMEVSQVKSAATALQETQRQMATISSQVHALTAQVAERLDRAGSGEEWKQTVTQLRSELDTLRSEWSRTRDTAGRPDRSDAEHQRLAAELLELKGAVAQLRPELQQTATLQSEIAALRARFESLVPQVAEVNPLKESLTRLALRFEQSGPPRAGMADLAPRVEALETFQNSIIMALKLLSGTDDPADVQVASLKQWADRIEQVTASRPAPEIQEDLRELKSDIKVIKVLMSDMVKRTGKETPAGR